MTELSAEYVREILDYDSETGEFTWAKTISSRKPAGTKAGYRDGRYFCVGINSKKHLLHRLAWLHFYGEWPRGDVDHINGDRYDNSITNLRCVSAAENMKNLPRRCNNTSGAPGVYFQKKTSRWYAQSCDGGVNRHLGFFDTFEEAAAARRKYQEESGFHANHGRSASLCSRKADLVAAEA